MNYEEQIKGMQVPGSVYYKVLHMPENARHNFLVSVKQLMSNYEEQFEFWKEAWKIRDINAEKLINPGERFRFMKERCSGDVDHHLWADRWQRIDAREPNYINAEERAEQLDSNSQDIPEQKPVSIRHRMKKLGLLRNEPNFNESAREEFDYSIQLSRL